MEGDLTDISKYYNVCPYLSPSSKKWTGEKEHIYNIYDKSRTLNTDLIFDYIKELTLYDVRNNNGIVVMLSF